MKPSIDHLTSDAAIARIVRGQQLEMLRELLRQFPFRPRPKHIEYLIKAYKRGAFRGAS